ncbi:uncharacterized protein LOC127708732 [Mytilus californianus]|uniref:uncharacterized protein LOC127708732 n=1 Tax=Mytilus californianus TaxID=6549 RepID=UPI0022465D47|nr:uncharacterized protein LOC127708732 [Mytilus californianus]XP_052069818.1 uncharacterized protein LOC127708732 [Mytilus californianus]
MFSFGRIFKSCSGGCQLLWSDPNKQAGAYDAVNKDDKEEIDELDLELLSTSDAVLSQPHGGRRASWSLDMESPIVRNHAPIVKNASKASSLERNQSFSGQNSSSIVKTRTPPRDAFTISNSPIVKNKTPPKKSTNKTSTVAKTRTTPRNAFENSTPSVEVSGNDNTEKLVSASTPDLSSKSTEYGPKIHSSKSSKKVKKSNSELALQVVSVV